MIARGFHAAIACGGTGGHLFPGLSVAREMLARGHDVTVLISEKEVDQKGVRGERDIEVVALPAVGLQAGNRLAFLRAAWRSRKICRERFRARRPEAVLAMGGFTSAPPILAGRDVGAATFLHESNMIPGRANRWLAHFVDECFTGFPEGAQRLWHPKVVHTGTPVRDVFQPMDPEGCRMILGLRPEAPTILVTGGSQGASAVNQWCMRAMPLIRERLPGVQWILLTGSQDELEVRAACARLGIDACVRPFLSEMETALGAATIVISRAGASSMAELAAMQRPAILIPYPAASDDHQTANARAAAAGGGAVWLRQQADRPEILAGEVIRVMANPGICQSMSRAWAGWHRPDSAALIVTAIEQFLQLSGRLDGRPSGLEPIAGGGRLGEVVG